MNKYFTILAVTFVSHLAYSALPGGKYISKFAVCDAIISANKDALYVTFVPKKEKHCPEDYVDKTFKFIKNGDFVYSNGGEKYGKYPYQTIETGDESFTLNGSIIFYLERKCN